MLVLDSGGVSRLARRRPDAAAIIAALIAEGLWPPVVPSVVLAETITGRQRNDANINRFLETCDIIEDLPHRLARRVTSVGPARIGCRRNRRRVRRAGWRSSDQRPRRPVDSGSEHVWPVRQCEHSPTQVFGLGFAGGSSWRARRNARSSPMSSTSPRLWWPGPRSSPSRCCPAPSRRLAPRVSRCGAREPQ